MAKVQKISQFQYNLQFQNAEENFNNVYVQLLNSNLGKIYQAIPWKNLVDNFNIKKYKKGPDCIFSLKGKLGLMFLKHYACCSDAKLIEQLNANVHYQIFCDILLSTGETISNFKIVSQIRGELSEHLNIDKIQKTLASYWLPYMQEVNHATTDATCYESELRFPTNQKLLWESVNWTYGQMQMLCKYLKIKKLRTKYLKWKIRYSEYSKKRRKPSKNKRVLTRSLLHLLNNINQELDKIEENYSFDISDKYFERRHIIRNIYSWSV